MTVRENVRIAVQAHRGGDAWRFWRNVNAFQDHVAGADRILDRIGLRDRAERPAQNLSHGEKRSLEVGIALAGEPDLLLLDEPTAGVAGALFAAYTRTVSPETTFFFLVTADALVTTIIGGFGTLAGPLYGTVFHEWLSDVLSSESGGLAPYLRGTLPEGVLSADVAGVTVIDLINSTVDGRAPLYLGVVFELFVLFVPNGLLGTVRDRIGGTAAKRTRAALVRRRRGDGDR